ncbi:rhodanese-like domain-containing protein [Patescibacteria group bacterium]
MDRKNILTLIIAVLAVVGAVYFLAPTLLNNVDRLPAEEEIQEEIDEQVGIETVSLDPERIDREVFVGEAILVDVRTDAELEETGYAANSIHFDLARLEAGELPEFPQDIKVYTYCKAGTRAGKANDILEANGFTNVVNIGGLIDWEQAGGLVVKE